VPPSTKPTRLRRRWERERGGVCEAPVVHGALRLRLGRARRRRTTSTWSVDIRSVPRHPLFIPRLYPLLVFLLRFGCWCYYFGSSTLAADTVGSSALLPSAAALWHVWYVPSLYSCYLVCCDLQACTSLDATPLMVMQAWPPSILTFMRPRPCGCANLHLLRWPFMAAFYRRHVRRRRPPLWSAPPPPLPLPLRFWASFDGYAILHSTLSASSR